MLLDVKQMDPKFEQWYKEFMSTRFPTVKSAKFVMEKNNSYVYNTDSSGNTIVDVPMNIDISTLQSIMPTAMDCEYKNAPHKNVNIYWDNDIETINTSKEGSVELSPTLEYGNYVPISMPKMIFNLKDIRVPKDYTRWAPINVDNEQYAKEIPADILKALAKDTKTTYVSNAADMFIFCRCLQELPSVGLDFTKAQNVSRMFYGCTSIKSIPDEYLNLPSVPGGQNTDGMFSNVSLDYIDFDKVKFDNLKSTSNTFDRMTWKECSGELFLPNTKIINSMFHSAGENSDCAPLINAPSATSTSQVFYDSKFTVINGINAPLSTAVSELFRGCKLLKEVKIINLPLATSVRGMFYECSQLTSIPAIDLSHVKPVDLSKEAKYWSIGDIFYKCTSLTEVRFKNVPDYLAPYLTKENLDTSNTAKFTVVIENQIESPTE